MGIQYERFTRKGFSVLLKEGFTKKSIINKVNEIAKVIAHSHWKTSTNQALLERKWMEVPGNQVHTKTFEEISVDMWDKTLRQTLIDGACIHTAMDEGEIVGAVAVLKLEDQINIIRPKKVLIAENECEKQVSRPDLTDCEEKKKHMTKCIFNEYDAGNLWCSVRDNLAAHMREYRPKLWQISSLAVKEGHRGKGIGKELFSRTLSEVPSGGVVYLIAEPDATKLYEGFGFALSGLEDHQHIQFVFGENKNPETITIPVMILKKEGLKRERETEESNEVIEKSEPERKRKVKFDIESGS